LFNALTGLNQRVGNFAGVTVEGKVGHTKLLNKQDVQITDLPGTYSLYPKSGDEVVTYDALFTTSSDLIIIVVDASNLKRNLLFASQIIDLGKPSIIALTMLDVAAKKGIIIDQDELSIQLGVPIIGVNPRKGKGITQLKAQLEKSIINLSAYSVRPLINAKQLAPELITKLQLQFPHLSSYGCLHVAAETNLFQNFSAPTIDFINNEKIATAFNKNKVQANEIIQRFGAIKNIMQVSVVEDDPLKKELRTERLDKILLHPVYGNLILLVVLFFLFQAIFWLASFPMDWIDYGFSYLTQWVGDILPAGKWNNLLTNGLLAGIGGVIIFVPQIIILFALITVLEDTGYMARISFLTDRLMRSVGLNGKSVLPMISAVACAVPAIMSARTIDNYKERLITILITPLMSCSARLPVYTILIALVIPNKIYWGFISLQGLVMMGLYLLGFVLALIVAKISSKIINVKGKSIFLMELPIYRSPRWQNIIITVIEKARLFVWNAGKVIIVVSLILWVMSNFGPSKTFSQLEQRQEKGDTTITPTQLLEQSYTGYLGKAITPIFKPLGYDWKISIAIITSFAAREVFVGTMATLYSVPDADENSITLKQKIAAASDENGNKIYTLATGVSLLLFYVFAMQCMSTLAIVYKETKSLTIPLIQFIYMFVLAYGFAYVAYELLK
jgi:ferrous iron transport protein B